MKIVINRQFGGFNLSDKAIERLKELNYNPPEEHGTIEEDLIPDNDVWKTRKYYGFLDIPRTHPLLIQVIEELGLEANGSHATLKVVEIPDDVDYSIEEYDGNEHIREVSREWR